MIFKFNEIKATIEKKDTFIYERQFYCEVMTVIIKQKRRKKIESLSIIEISSSCIHKFFVLKISLSRMALK
uniref:Uncharacterized protein n=1 Tax=Ascaris lumbricoides TaxID=6252 RepID=A0A0M3IJK7_ASCLU